MQRNNLIISVDRYDYTDFMRRNSESAAVSLLSYVTMLIVHHIIEPFQTVADPGQQSLSVDCPSDLTISHDSRWTSEALFNILDNAVKYTSAGGSIQVRVRDWEMYLRIDVTDTGRGIPEYSQGTIFKRFYRDEAVHDIDGVGIGLYLAREIITMQGGYITVESKVGEESTFSVFLPIK